MTSARVRRSERSVRKPAARAWQQRTGGHARHVNDQIGRAARIATRELASDAFSIDDRARLTLKVSVCVCSGDPHQTALAIISYSVLNINMWPQSVSQPRGQW